MPVLLLILFVVIAITVGVPTVKQLVHGAAMLRRRRRIAETRRTPIGHIVGGDVEVRGRVLEPPPPVALLQAPMTGRPCVAYRFIVRERQTRLEGTGSRSVWLKTRWVTLVDEQRSAGCVLDDGTGRIEVPLLAATSFLKADAKTRTGVGRPASVELSDLLSIRYNVKTTGWLFNKAMTFREIILAPGDELYVIGRTRRIANGHRFEATGDASDDELLVTDRTEGWLLQQTQRAAYSALGLGVLGVVAIVGAVVVVLLLANTVR